MSKTYAPGDFSFWDSPYEERLYKNAYDAITTENLWEWMKNASPPENKGFMFWDTPELKRINKHMDVMGHSGFSYAMTMRTMENVAKKGWDTYVAETIEAIKKHKEEEAEKERKRLEKEAEMARREAAGEYVPAHYRSYSYTPLDYSRWH